MFFQALVYVAILVIAAWTVWKLIIKPILEGNGIQVEEDEDTTIRTSHTKKLDDMKKEFYKKTRSAEAAEESVMVSVELNNLDERIKDADEKIKDNS